MSADEKIEDLLQKHSKNKSLYRDMLDVMRALIDRVVNKSASFTELKANLKGKYQNQPEVLADFTALCRATVESIESYLREQIKAAQ